MVTVMEVLNLFLWISSRITKKAIYKRKKWKKGKFNKNLCLHVVDPKYQNNNVYNNQMKMSKFDLSES